MTGDQAVDRYVADLALMRRHVREDLDMPPQLAYVTRLVFRLALWADAGELSPVRVEWVADQAAAALLDRGHPPAVVEHWVGTLREQFDAV